MRDPYTILGVSKSAGEKDIKSAYRRLAKALHPDQNKEDPSAQAKFAEATAAYDLLSDSAKRAKFDRGEIDAEGNPTMKGFDFAGFGGGRRTSGGFSAEDILRDFMGGMGGGGFGANEGPMGATMGRGGGFRTAAPRGPDVSASIKVSLEDAHRGATVTVRLPNGRSLSVKIPEGVEDGQQIRLKGQGEPSPGGGGAGDALITVRLARHKKFRREGADLHVELPVTLYEAVLGGKVRVPTLDGLVELNLPPGANTSKALRLKGKGMATDGDLMVHLQIVLPRDGDPDLENLMRHWRQEKPYDVRED